MTGSDKENLVANNQADKSPMSNVSSSHSAVGMSPVVFSQPSSSLSLVAGAGVPVISSRCTPVIGNTSLPSGCGSGDFLAGIPRFVLAVLQ